MDTAEIKGPPLTSREVLRIPTVRLMAFALGISTFGDFLALFAVLSVVSFKMQATAAQVTWVQVASLLPLVLVSPLAGVFVDRWPLKRVLVSSDLIRAALTLLLLAASQLWQLYLVLALISIISAFFGPAQQSTIRTSVPPEGMMATSALMQQAIFLVHVVSPAIAGLLIASFGAVSCYLIDAASFVGSALLIGAAIIPRRPAEPLHNVDPAAGSLRKVWLDMRVGLVFIVHGKAILFVILALAAAVFTLGCFGPLVAIYVRDTVHGSARMFGLTSSMIGAGILVGFIAVQRLARTLANNVLVLGGLLGMAAGCLALRVMPQIAVMLVSAFIIGLSVAAILLPAQTLLQQDTPEQLMGRVGSTAMAIVFGAQIVGLLLSGLLTTFVGVRQVFLLCAVFLLLMAIAGALSLRRKTT